MMYFFYYTTVPRSEDKYEKTLHDFLSCIVAKLFWFME